MSNIHLQSLRHSQLVLEALKSRKKIEILIEGNDKLRSTSSGLWIWSPLIRSIFGSLGNVEETVVIVPDFSSKDIKTGLDVIDTEYQELLRFSPKTKSFLETLGVHFEAREDDNDRKDTDEKLMQSQEIKVEINRDEYNMKGYKRLCSNPFLTLKMMMRSPVTMMLVMPN